MKKLIQSLLFLSLLFLTGQLSYAQLSDVIPKSDMINILDDVNDLGVSGDKNDKLKKQNESFVNDLFDIVDGDQSEEDKKSALSRLKKDNEKKLTDLLGADTYKSYKKKMKNKFKPFKRKANLLKFAL